LHPRCDKIQEVTKKRKNQKQKVTADYGSLDDDPKDKKQILHFIQDDKAEDKP
jgi:hypothetical protein